MPKLTINGQEVEARAGQTVLQAALAVGLEIPHYCYHPGLSIAGNCRMCLVEVERAPKLMIACDSRVQDGMVVRTDSERVLAARRAMMEFFLINHPLDCPICDQAGECRLQEYAMAHGAGESRYVEPKLSLEKAVDIGRHVMLDQERCIQCSRCIRFCDEVTHTGELAFFRRGERTVIGVYPERPLDNPYSGNVVDICPVGALTLKEFRFKTRVWYLKNTPSTCAACARGCNVFVGVGTQQLLMTTRGQQDERIKRIVPRFNEAVNGHWMCDEGRLSFQKLYAAPRLGNAQAPAGNPVSWDDAVTHAATALREAAASGRAAALLSPRITSEDMLGWRLLLEKLGGALVGVRSLVRGEDDDLLVRADKGGNSRGAAWIFGEQAREEDVVAAVRSGGVDTLVVVGDPLDPADTADVDAAARQGITRVVFVGPFVAGAAASASVVLPSAAWSEEEGTQVNFEGRIQRVNRCHLPEGEGRPGWRIALDIATAAGVELPAWTSARDVLASLARIVREYDGLDAETIGLLGVAGRRGTPAAV
jgi:NADH-quinone oxidoreductase subunit G